MRIKKIIFKNYRQLRETEINFGKKQEHDLHLIIGKNGTGKTNMLNAINWCFYNDEPNLTIEQQRLPILNRNEIANFLGESASKDVCVEISMEGDNSEYIFKRTAYFKAYRETRRVIPQHTDFEIEIISKVKDNSEIETLKNKRAEDFIEAIIPKSVRDFYFFDGERLDSYFKGTTSQNIKHSIFILSQIELLENVERKINSILKELTQKASSDSPNIEKAKDNHEKSENKQAIAKKEILECKLEIDKAKSIIGECDEKLRNMPNTKELQNRKDKIFKQKDLKKGRLKTKNEEKTNKLFDYGIKILLWSAIKYSIETIKDKRKKNEIPPDIKSELLEEIISKDFCMVCKRKLDSNSKEILISSIKEKRIISEVGRKLEGMERSLYSFEKELGDYVEEIKTITTDIKDLEKDLYEIDKEILEIDKQLTGYNIQEINRIIEVREINDELYSEKNQLFGVLDNRLRKQEVELIILAKILNDAIKHSSRTIEIRKKIFLLIKTREVLIKSKENLISKTRKKIGERTKEIFFNLIWKKGDFKDIFIDENYNLILLDLFNTPCLGAISRAEKLLLSLSFTYAIQEVNSFNASFVIDTPVSPTDDINRENLGRTFAKVSMDKQLILLFIPTEYSEEISKILEQIAATKHLTNFNTDTRETKLEAVK